jgi:putative transcriptional regulator
MILYAHGTRKDVKKLNKIKEIRKKLGLSIYQVAELSGLTPSYISNLENDNRTNPSRDTMQSIASALNESVLVIFFPDEKSDMEVS